MSDEGICEGEQRFLLWSCQTEILRNKALKYTSQYQTVESENTGQVVLITGVITASFTQWHPSFFTHISPQLG